MKIIITRQTFVKGEFAEPGDVYDSLPDADVVNLITTKKAVKYSEEDLAKYKDEYLELAKGLSEKSLRSAAEELKIDIKGLERAEANKLVAAAMKAAEENK